MLFGLSNILISFQNYINEILAKKLNFFVIVYIDNIFIYIKNLGQDHIESVREVLDIQKKHRFFANLEKC